MMQRLHGEMIVNGKPFTTSVYCSSISQMSQFVYEYLDAPVSAKEVLADCGNAGAGHNPGLQFANVSCNVDETQFRYLMGPWIRDWVEVYNSYFDETGADLIIFPSAMAATPDLAACASGKVPVTPVGGATG